MKKFVTAFIALVMLAGMAKAEIVEIPVKKVPDLGLRMVKSYFPTCSIVKAAKDNTKDMKNRTCVVLDNNATIDFDKDGNWLIVDCRETEVPTRMVPGKILMYLNKNQAGKKVLFMGREIKNGDINILLNDNTELHFTNEHELIP